MYDIAPSKEFTDGEDLSNIVPMDCQPFVPTSLTK